MLPCRRSIVLPSQRYNFYKQFGTFQIILLFSLTWIERVLRKKSSGLTLLKVY
jgi:hypothetical protein